MMETDVDRMMKKQKEKGLVIVIVNGERRPIVFGNAYSHNTKESFAAYTVNPRSGWLEFDVFKKSDIVFGTYEEIYFPPISFTLWEHHRAGYEKDFN